MHRVDLERIGIEQDYAEIRFMSASDKRLQAGGSVFTCWIEGCGQLIRAQRALLRSQATQFAAMEAIENVRTMPTLSQQN